MTSAEAKLVMGIAESLRPQFGDVVDSVSADNFKAIGTAITRADMKLFWNEWVDQLMNKVALTIISSKMLRNKLKPFIRGDIQYGDIVEEIFVDAARGEMYTGPELYGVGQLCDNNPFCKTKPSITSMYHRVNRRERYPTTIFRESLKSAFTSDGGVTRLVNDIVQSLYSGAERDGYLWMKELFAEYVNNPVVALAPDQTQQVPLVIDTDTGNVFLATIQAMIEALSFNATNFNPMRRETYSAAGDMTLFIKAGIQPILNVETMARAFNQSRLETGVKIEVVDNFGTGTWDDTTDTGIAAMLLDDDWWMVRNRLQEFTSQWNPKDLYWNYWLHIWQMLGTSYYKNGIIFEVS